MRLNEVMLDYMSKRVYNECGGMVRRGLVQYGSVLWAFPLRYIPSTRKSFSTT